MAWAYSQHSTPTATPSAEYAQYAQMQQLTQMQIQWAYHYGMSYAPPTPTPAAPLTTPSTPAPAQPVKAQKPLELAGALLSPKGLPFQEIEAKLMNSWQRLAAESRPDDAASTSSPPATDTPQPRGLKASGGRLQAASLFCPMCCQLAHCAFHPAGALERPRANTATVTAVVTTEKPVTAKGGDRSIRPPGIFGQLQQTAACTNGLIAQELELDEEDVSTEAGASTETGNRWEVDSDCRSETASHALQNQSASPASSARSASSEQAKARCLKNRGLVQVAVP